MALVPTFPAPTGRSTSTVESRRALAGLVVRDAAGLPRAGVLPRSTAPLAVARASMGVDIAAFEAVFVRSGLPAFGANDGTVTVPIGAAPSANSRYHVVYARQNEQNAPGTEANNNTVLEYVTGTAAASPDLAGAIALVPAGGLPLVAVLVPSTATTTQSTGVTLTPVFPMTALAGDPIPVRALSELAASTWGAGTIARSTVNGFEYEYLPADGTRANAAGWYRREGSITTRNRSAVWNIHTTSGATPIDYSNAEATPDTADFSYSSGTFTCRRAGTYRFTVLFGVGSQGQAVGYLATLRKNGAALAESVNVASTVGATGVTLVSDVTLVPGDTLAVTGFSTLPSPGIGTDPTGARNRVQISWIGA